jgi:hypothetical protein
VKGYFASKQVELPEPNFLNQVSLDFGVVHTDQHYHDSLTDDRLVEVNQTIAMPKGATKEVADIMLTRCLAKVTQL